MSAGLKVVKGMKDILPEEMSAWHFVETQLKSIVSGYGYQEIRTPILEPTELFKRAIGEVTDIVEKEMYTFIDKGGDSLTLRPEGTASCVRAVIENSLVRNQPQKLWYLAPMFRRERPQKGRYRQFYQFGVEALGLEGPDIDAEQLIMMARLWRQLGIENKIVLQLNSLGVPEERNKYKEALVSYLQQCPDLDEDSQRRLLTNPMRVLDSKNPAMQPIIEKSPILLDFLGEHSLAHFETLQGLLKAVDVPFEINPRIVRGLDYYSHTVYEWVTTELGSQGSVGAGGRYNNLVSQLGGGATPAVGFSLGMERLVMLLQANQLIPARAMLDVYLVAEGERAQAQILPWAEKLRNAIPTLRVMAHCGGGSFKSQFKRADKSGATFALILGDKEIETHTIGLKALREDAPQQTMPLDKVINYLIEKINHA